jgi:4-aminobutyrate--pyruvate transaminase
VPPRTYFEKIQAVLRKYDVLFVADEVICGFWRTGNYWGSQTFGMQPDILTCAKALSSAYLPISATVINEKLYQGLATQADKNGSFIHGFTYSGHPVCAAVALETLNIYEERNIVGHVRKISQRFVAGVQRFADHPLVGEVRTVGLMAGIELVRDKATKQSFDSKAGVGAYFEERAREHGLIMRGRGEQLVLSPPLIITESEIDDMLGRLARALDETETFVASLP